MAKNNFRGMPGGMNQAAMMKQAQKMQQEMLRMQEEQQSKTFTAKSGGGMVAATVSGKQELKMPEVGFFQTGPNAPVKGTMEGGKLVLRCDNAFILGMVNTPETLAAVGRKATILLKQPISAVAVDASKLGQSSAKLDQLLAFGKAHRDIIHIQD